MAYYSGELRTHLEEYQTLGAKQGQQGSPPTNATSPDQHECKIISAAQKYFYDEVSLAKQSLSELENNSYDIECKCQDFQHSLNQLTDESESFNTAKQKLLYNQDSFIQLKFKELMALAEIKFFRAENKLSRPARYPASILSHLSLIFSCIVAETIINAFFFENEKGLLGGSLVAFAVSVVNLSMAGVFGYASTFKNHVEPLRKSFGYLSLMLCIFSTVYLNAVFSTFRFQYQLVKDPTNLVQTAGAFKLALADAAELFKLHIPFGDILSFILFFIGLLLGLFAFYKGYTWDDPYPGYGNIDKRFNKSENDYLNADKSMINEIITIFEDHSKLLKKIKLDIATEIKRISNSRNALMNIKTRLNASVQQINDDLKLLLGTYRQSNMSVRVTAAPQYFSQYEPISMGENVLSDLDQILDKYSRLTEICINPYQSMISFVNDKYKTYTDMTSNFLKCEVNNFREDVLKMAKMKINQQVNSH